VVAVKRLADLLNPGGKLFLSASGIASELGEGYPGRGVPAADRYAPLADEMAKKHGIHGMVCLYSLEDLEELLLQAGLVCEALFASPFGNVKGVGHRPEAGA
jgi:hypothetical protein